MYITDHTMPLFNDPFFIFSLVLYIDSFGHSIAIIVILLCCRVCISDILDPCMYWILDVPPMVLSKRLYLPHEY